eukprot:CFRG3936T1
MRFRTRIIALVVLTLFFMGLALKRIRQDLDNESADSPSSDTLLDDLQERKSSVEDGKKSKAADLWAQKFEFIMYRNIGNDLPPRHEVGQTYRNVKFILENEQKFPELETRWLLNRLVNKTEEARVISLLKSHGQKWHSSPFIVEEFSKVKFRFEDFEDNPDIIRTREFRKWKSKKQGELMDHIYHDKNRYIMHNNEARNIMLEEGIVAGAKWILAWDGNCFLTPTAWHNISTTVRKNQDSKYFWVPMERLLETNDVLFDPSFKPRLVDEPQLIFRYDAKERFNGDMRYGRRSKVEMLWRLQIPGPWDKWGYHPWEKRFQTWVPSTDKPVGAGVIPVAGWVARLFSGRPQLETDLIGRGLDRVVAIRSLIDRCDADVARDVHGLDTESPMMWNLAKLKTEKEEVGKNNGEFTAIKKQFVEISESYILLGERNAYDDGLATLSSHVNVLTLTSFLTNEFKYAQHAAKVYIRWFTRTTNEQKITDMKEHRLCGFLLDSLRLLQQVGAISSPQFALIKKWHSSYLEIVLLNNKLAFKSGSVAGKGMADEIDFPKEYWGEGPISVIYDVQTAAVSAFVGDVIQFLHTTERAKMKMMARIRDQGDIRAPKLKDQGMSDAVEIEAWLMLARLASRGGVDLYGYQGQNTLSNKYPILLNAINYAQKTADKIFEAYLIHWYHIARVHYPPDEVICESDVCDKFTDRYPKADPPAVWSFGIHATI